MPSTSPFKEELVARPLEGWLADDFQYEALQGWAQLQRDHSTSQYAHTQRQIKVGVSRPGQLCRATLAPELPVGLARAAGQGLHYSHLVPLPTLASLPSILRYCLLHTYPKH